MAYQLSESKLWSAITAVASGVMTSLLYDLISPTAYILYYSQSQYMLTPNQSNTKNTLWSALCILIIFFLMWGTFSAVIYIWNKVSKQLIFRKTKNYSGKQIVHEYKQAKRQSLDLKNIFFNEPADPLIINLYLRDLANIISSLHAKFYPKNRHQQIHIKNYFRCTDHSTIICISNTISKYEFIALLELLEKMISKASECSAKNTLIQHDCNEMSQLLNDLKETLNSLL